MYIGYANNFQLLMHFVISSVSADLVKYDTISFNVLHVVSSLTGLKVSILCQIVFLKVFVRVVSHFSLISKWIILMS
jgi:hypothetical protein